PLFCRNFIGQQHYQQEIDRRDQEIICGHRDVHPANCFKDNKNAAWRERYFTSAWMASVIRWGNHKFSPTSSGLPGKASVYTSSPAKRYTFRRAVKKSGSNWRQKTSSGTASVTIP